MWRTLWDLLDLGGTQERAPAEKPRPAARPAARRRKQPSDAGASGAPARRPTRRAPEAAQAPRGEAGAGRVAMQARYDEVVRVMLARHGVRVRRWRTSMSGVAWEVRYRDGTVARLIESPRPKGPMSAAVFLHEVGHHAIGLGVFRPRCLEEYHAWVFAIEHMDAHGLNITESVHRRMHESLRYAVAKASRRGIRALPAELLPYRRPFAPGAIVPIHRAGAPGAGAAPGGGPGDGAERVAGEGARAATEPARRQSSRRTRSTSSPDPKGS